MPFVNEYISDEDIKWYGIEEADRRLFNITFRPEWTINRERDVYLRLVGSGREEFANHKRFALYWEGKLILIRLDQQTGRSSAGCSVHYELLGIELATDLASSRPQVLMDLKEALTTYAGGGVNARSQNATSFGF